MVVFDLNSGGLADPGGVTRPHAAEPDAGESDAGESVDGGGIVVESVAITTDTPPQELASRAAPGPASITIHFPRFSDGRGFTLARHLRQALRYEGVILASGHLLPDQADYLRRCGFSHVEIDPDAVAQWRLSLSMVPPAMQHLLASRRARHPPADRA